MQRAPSSFAWGVSGILFVAGCGDDGEGSATAATTNPTASAGTTGAAGTGGDPSGDPSGDSTGAPTSGPTGGETDTGGATDGTTDTGEPPVLVCDGFEPGSFGWSLPDVGAIEEVLDDMFHDSNFGCANADEDLTVSLMDLTGDGRPDLVVTDACDLAGVGTSEWRVFAGEASGFAAKSTSYALPDVGAIEEVLDDMGHDSSFGCANPDEDLTFVVTDLTGDGRPDLVVTDACDAAGVGTSEWRVFAGEASGFAAKSTSYALPDVGAIEEVLDDMFHDSNFGCANADEDLTFAVTDLTGDGRPDLVVTDACDLAGVGTSEWRVFAGEASGFAAKSTSYALPDVGAIEEVLDDMFHDSNFGCANADEDLTFALTDLTGDGRPDLVVTDACDLAGVGTSEWRVFAGEASGFAAKSSSYALPDVGAIEEVLDDLAHDSNFGCANADEDLTFALTDLTGDGRPDLVVTDACDLAGVGTSEWRVFAGEASGFAAKNSSWKLPDVGAIEEVLDDMAHDSNFGCANADEDLTFALTDLSGDGRPDLVLTDACDVAGIGTVEWRVYASSCAPG